MSPEALLDPPVYTEKLNLSGREVERRRRREDWRGMYKCFTILIACRSTSGSGGYMYIKTHNTNMIMSLTRTEKTVKVGLF